MKKISFIVILFSYVFTCAGQNNWYVSENGNDITGNGTVNNPWRNIQYANNHSAVLNGDIINIAAGAYSEYINITKSLKFYGPNYNISPNPATTGRNPEAVITAISTGEIIFEAKTPGTSIEIKGLKFLNGSPLRTHEQRNPVPDIDIVFEKNWINHCRSVFFGSLTPWRTVTITDNFFQSIDLTSTSSAIELKDLNDASMPYHAATVTVIITDNIIDGTNWAGILMDNLLSATVLRNTVKNVPETGIKLAGGMGNAVISQNIIDNANTANIADVGGIRIYGSEFTGTIHVTNNKVTNSFTGFAVLTGENISGKNIHVNNNSFDNTNSNYAIYHGGSGNLNATCNWLGSSSGITNSARIHGPVTYNPFLNNGADNEINTFGFQSIPGSCPISGSFFTRSVLTSGLNRPWEMTYGPDNMLWITQNNGRVSRVDPNSGVVTTIYTAPDYFAGDPAQAELLPCDPTYAYPVSSGTYGLALHPDFITTPYIYFIYSYNSSPAGVALSKYKVRRLTWNAATQTVSNPADIITDLPLDHYHEGMRMIIITQAGIPYIYITAGDGTVDDDRCYPSGNNANLKAQDWNSLFGKTLRYNIDGSIPSSNPITGSPVFTKGHRNSLGLAYNPVTDIIYSSENGKSTDDEINILLNGKNYGWPKARGYHTDNNYPGENTFVSTYTPSFAGDQLKESIYSWCPATVPLPEDPQTVSTTCVVAPSDMMYYPDNGSIPEFRNSLLITSLKNTNPNFRACVYVFKLNAAGTGLETANPNPQVFFAVPDPPSLRYRDITMSPDGKSIFICTDSWDGINNQILKFQLVVALPVKLTSFNISQRNCLSTLKWSITSSSNPDKFVIEKSMNGLNWITTGTVQAGNTGNLDFTFIDNSFTNANSIYYRINITDKNGTSELSDIKVIRNECILSNNVKVKPNPVSTQFKIETNRSAVFTTQIFNAQMQLVHTMDKVQSGSVIDISKFVKGVYFLRLQNTGDKTIEYIKLVKE